MKGNQDYLSLFKEKVDKEKAIMEMEKQKIEREKAAQDSRKPAMFRKSYHKQLQKQNQQSELLVTKSSALTPEQAEAMGENIDSMAQLHATKVKDLEKVLKEKQLRFLAFLTRNYSMLQFKGKKCEYHCYGDVSRSMNEVEECVDFCSKGVSQAYKFSESKQLEIKQRLLNCEAQAPQKALKGQFEKGSKPNLKEVTLKKDPFHTWLKCYTDLLNDMDELQDSLKTEFENYS